MLRIRPLKRLTVCEILNHPWMRSEKFEMSSNSEVNVNISLITVFVLVLKILKWYKWVDSLGFIACNQEKLNKY